MQRPIVGRMEGHAFAVGDRVWARRFADRLLGRRGRPGRIAMSAGTGAYSDKRLWYVRLDAAPSALEPFFEDELAPELERVRLELEPVR